MLPQRIAFDTNNDNVPDLTRTLTRNTDPLLRDTGYTLGTPTSPSATDASATYQYDPAGRLASVSPLPLGEGQGEGSFSYAYTEGRPALIATVVGPVHTVTNTWEPQRNALDIKTNRLNTADER